MHCSWEGYGTEGRCLSAVTPHGRFNLWVHGHLRPPVARLWRAKGGLVATAEIGSIPEALRWAEEQILSPLERLSLLGEKL